MREHVLEHDCHQTVAAGVTGDEEDWRGQESGAGGVPGWPHPLRIPQPWGKHAGRRGPFAQAL